MDDDTTNLVLEHFRAISADLHEIKDELRKQGETLARIESGIEKMRAKKLADPPK